MIGNRNMRRSAKKKQSTFYFDISLTTAFIERIADPTCAIRVLGLHFLATVATNGGTVPDAMRVGIVGSLTKYFSQAPPQNKAVNTVTSHAPSSSDIIPAGTTLLFDRGAVAGGTNTGEVLVVLEYELLDDTPLP